MTGAVAHADDDAVQKEVIAATAACAETFNARDAQRIAALYAEHFAQCPGETGNHHTEPARASNESPDKARKK
jgi:ketosteroid isomerase-like protein